MHIKNYSYILLILFILATPAKAELNVEIVEGSPDAIKIAVIPFHWWDKSSRERAYPIDLVIVNNLTSSGLFNPLKHQSLIQKPTSLADVDFQRWKIRGVDYIVIGHARVMENNLITARFELVDVLRKKKLVSRSWNNLKYRELRRLAHRISDLVHEQTTGIRGVFSTRISYVTGNTRGKNRRTFVLEIADSDGYNSYPLLRSTEPILSPTWSPDGSKLAYVSFEKGKSQIIVQSLDGKVRYSLADYKGINGAPAWSKDGRYIAMSLSKGGNPDIYVWDFKRRTLRRITNHYAIDTEPAWSPDGETLYFTSDRRGNPHIFKIDLRTMKVSRVTFKGRFNAGASVSPDGQSLALVHGNRGRFNIALLNLRTHDLQILTASTLDESPSFSPNGQMILYSTIDGRENILAMVSINGRGAKKLRAKKNNVQEPDWGPLL